jgi:hypothetical protein
MRAERDIKAANLARSDLHALIRGDTSRQVIVDDPFAEAERLFSLDQPSLQALSHILRHRELWPESFVWNYASCQTCAMGLAQLLWSICPAFPSLYDSLQHASRVMKMERFDTCVIFGGFVPLDGSFEPETQAAWTRKGDGSGSMDHVTPEMVADKIDEYLARAK